MGNLNGDGLGEFFCIDVETLQAKGTWIRSHEKATFGYDFWYQPYHDTLIATEWGAPRVFKKGFVPKDAYDPSKYLFKNQFYYKKTRNIDNLSYQNQMIDNLQRSMAET